MTFQVTYVPIYETRISHSKTFVNLEDKPIAQIYNQGANLIETRYFGENIKGTIARLGNVEKTITYCFSRLNDIPKAGQLYNKDFYISAVHTTIYPTCFICTIALSKDFNRLSQYVNISSENRYYQVSENQAYDRNVLLKEYILVGDDEQLKDNKLVITNFYPSIRNIFIKESNEKQVNNVIAQGFSYNNTKLQKVLLPVVSSAFGNVMSFSFAYKDNYSAGEFAVNVEEDVNLDNITGYWQTDLAYCDYYGKIYYYAFDLSSNFDPNPTMDKALKYPDTSETLSSRNYLLLRKDSREKIQFNCQVEFVTNKENYILGSALASQCGLVRGASTSERTPRIYFFNEPLNKFDYQYLNVNQMPKLPNGKTENGTTFNDDKDVLEIYGTPTDTAVYTIYSDRNKMILEAGETYYFGLDGLNKSLKNEVFMTIQGAVNGVFGDGYSTRYQNSFTVPSNWTGMQIFVAVTANAQIPNSILNPLKLTPMLVKGSKLESTNFTVSTIDNGKFNITAISPINAKSWAIITPLSTELNTVEDEYGNIVQQAIYSGGQLLIGSNEDITENQEITINFNIGRRKG